MNRTLRLIRSHGFTCWQVSETQIVIEIPGVASCDAKYEVVHNRAEALMALGY